MRAHANGGRYLGIIRTFIQRRAGSCRCSKLPDESKEASERGEHEHGFFFLVVDVCFFGRRIRFSNLLKVTLTLGTLFFFDDEAIMAIKSYR